MNNETFSNAEILWDYMRGDNRPEPADCLFVIGSLDHHVAEYAAKLANTYAYRHVLISGGVVGEENSLLVNEWQGKSEAELFLSIMRRAGYEEEALLETKALNTGDNVQLGYKLLAGLKTGLPRKYSYCHKTVYGGPGPSHVPKAVASTFYSVSCRVSTGYIGRVL